MSCSEIHVCTEDNAILFRCWHSKETAVYANETELKRTAIQQAQSGDTHVGLENCTATSLKMIIIFFIVEFNFIGKKSKMGQHSPLEASLIVNMQLIYELVWLVET